MDGERVDIGEASAGGPPPPGAPRRLEAAPEADPAERAVFALSRALYRRLGSAVAASAGATARVQVIDACELTMRRLAEEPDFARPARFLFEQIRSCYPLDEQLWVRRTVEAHVKLAREVLARLPDQRRECGAFTRAGDPCRREPVSGSEFCPSHRHLELLDDPARAAP